MKAFILLSYFFISVSQAEAHAFGSRYDLPLPLELYVSAAAIAVAFSFIILCIFLRPQNSFKKAPYSDLLALSYLKWLESDVFLNLIKFLSIAFFIFLLSTAYLGSANPLNNFASIFVWVVWWVGLAFISALLGNFWALINPWANLFSFFNFLRKKKSHILIYPQFLGFWPNVIFLVIFAWMELISGQAEQPKFLVTLILIYSGVTWAGMFLFGQRKWLVNGEVFHATFGILSKFAPTQIADGKWKICVPSTALLTNRPATIPEVIFVLVLLSTVTFDGILETPLWLNILSFISENLVLRPILIWLDAVGIDLIILIKTIALIIVPFSFFVVFSGFCLLISEFGSARKIPTKDILGYFVYSLVPIAIAYHLSHYLSYLVIAGQYLIPLLSDPYNLGWDLFGTQNYKVDIGIINAKLIWYVAVFSIIIGHIFAVYIAHVMAFRVFHDRKSAIQSQYPMMVLMIGYTMLSLWILSQPIVE